MEDYKVVITNYGFMTTKTPSEVLVTDDVLFTGTKLACNNFIHSVRIPRNKNIHN